MAQDPGFATAAEALRQVIDGEDFDGIDRLLNIKVDVATQVGPAFPYSIATNVKHADLWQRIWLARLTGGKRPTSNVFKDDWAECAAEEWPEVRQRFAEGMRQAHGIAASGQHSMKDDATANKLLLQIAIHNAYHVGQLKLMKRLLKGARDEG